MPTVIGANATEWKMREMARRAGKKYETEPTNPFANLNEDELEEQQSLLNEAIEQTKIDK
jgi:hypothetical protein